MLTTSTELSPLSNKFDTILSSLKEDPRQTRCGYAAGELRNMVDILEPLT